MFWWFIPLVLLLGVVFVLGRWPMINDVRTGHTPEYPDIQPQYLPGAPEAVFAAALSVARDAGWEIVQADAAKGRIEAMVTTRFLRFRDEVTILIVPAGQGGSRVDIRSRSRAGRGDLGTNARRIRAFQGKLRGLEV